jgi:hypothetical protein
VYPELENNIHVEVENITHEHNVFNVPPIEMKNYMVIRQIPFSLIKRVTIQGPHSTGHYLRGMFETS